MKSKDAILGAVDGHDLSVVLKVFSGVGSTFPLGCGDWTSVAFLDAAFVETQDLWGEKLHNCKQHSLPCFTSPRCLMLLYASFTRFSKNG